MRINTFLTSAIGLAAGALVATPATAAAEDFVVVKAGTIITVSGDEISGGEIVIVDGSIRLVGKGLDYPADATVIDASGETVMPGWVHPATRHDMPMHRRDGVLGNIVVAEDEILEDVDLSPLMEAGFTAIGAYPSGNGIPGVTGAIRTAMPDLDDPYDSRSQVLRTDSYLRVVMRNAGGSKDRFAGALRKAKGEIDKVAKAKADWEKKKAEADAKAKAAADKAKAEGKDAPEAEEFPAFKAPGTDPTHGPLIAWIEGDLAVPPVIELSRASDVVHLADVMKSWEDLSTANVMLTGASGMHHVIEMLAEGDAMVVTVPALSTMPQTSTVFNLPAALERAGVDFALSPEAPSGGGGGGFRGGRRGGGPPQPTGASRGNSAAAIGAYRSRLAMVVRAGLSREAAIKAVTLNAAKLLGVDDRIGSIETGKDADLVFLDGDAVDPLAEVTRVMILGEIVWEQDQ